MSGGLVQLHGAVVDLIYRVRAVPASGEEAIVTGFATAPGGGFNAAAAAVRSGLPVHYAGVLGTGPFAERVAGALAAEEIAVAGPRDAERDQGCCVVMVEPSGERSFVGAPGAEGFVTHAQLAGIPLGGRAWSALSGYQLHYEGSRDAFARWLGSDAALPPLIFDPSPVVAALGPAPLRAAMTRAAWITANQREAAQLSGHDDPAAAAASLAAGREGAVVRQGAAGCVVASGGRTEAVPPHRVRARDTNGAGDAHLGAFVAGLSRGMTAALAARHANVAAALSTLEDGPATAPRWAEVEAALARGPAGARTQPRETT